MAEWQDQQLGQQEQGGHWSRRPAMRPGRLARKIGPSKNALWTSDQPGALTTTMASSAHDDDRADEGDEHGSPRDRGDRRRRTNGGPLVVTGGPFDRSSDDGRSDYGVKTGAATLSESHSLVMSARLPSSVSA